MLPFHEAAGSERKQVLEYQGDVGVNLQHVGVLVGRSAHAAIWPAIFEWLGAPALANASNDARKRALPAIASGAGAQASAAAD